MAQSIPRTSDKWQLAQEEIRDWANQIERSEDQPILDLADELAVPGDERSLQAAIAQAQRIGPSRVMFDDAQSRISYWRARLDDLVSYRLPPEEPSYQEDSTLFPELEEPVDLAEPVAEVEPETQLQTPSLMSQAIETARQGTPDSLRAAMDIANGIPLSSVEYSEAEFEINNWGNQLLSQAENQSSVDPQSAIAIASKIPSYSAYYQDAQALISKLNAQSLQVTPANP